MTITAAAAAAAAVVTRCDHSTNTITYINDAHMKT